MTFKPEHIVEIVNSAAWPAVVLLATFLFKAQIRSVIDRLATSAKSVTFGKLQIEMSSAVVRAQTVGDVVDDKPLQALVASINAASPSANQLTDEDIERLDVAELPEDLKAKAIIPFLEASLDRLEYLSSIEINSMRRYVRLRSTALEQYVVGGAVNVNLYSEINDTTTVGVIILDIEGFAGPNDVINSAGAYLGMLHAALGEDRKWKLLVGVVSGKPDSTSRILAAQEYFAPAVNASRLTIVDLVPSVGMQDALLHGLREALAESLRRGRPE